MAKRVSRGAVRVLLAAASGALLLAGCASSPGPRPGQVLDQIQREMATAVAPAAPTTRTIEQALLPPLTLEPAKLASEARFDSSVQNAPADQVFMAIVGGTPYSMLVPPEVTGTLTLALKNVTVREVLDTIRDL